MKIYRMEDQNGRGIFNGPVLDNYRQIYNNMKNYPCAPLDRLIGRSTYDDEFCGTVSPRQLRYWFKFALADLVRGNAKIVIYEVGERFTTIGFYQVLFVGHKARKVMEYPAEVLPILGEV